MTNASDLPLFGRKGPRPHVTIIRSYSSTFKPYDTRSSTRGIDARPDSKYAGLCYQSMISCAHNPPAIRCRLTRHITKRVYACSANEDCEPFCDFASVALRKEGTSFRRFKNELRLRFSGEVTIDQIVRTRVVCRVSSDNNIIYWVVTRH